MPTLETVDMLGVEILSAGGPVHGVGSPPEGDHFTKEQLRGMAYAATELAGEINPPAKIGHKGGDPAVGWLDNIRINEDGSKLLADVRKVPKVLAALIDAGAYRHRSVEMARITSQKTGKQYEWAVTGLAWLGGKLPAVKTLADVVKLYEGDDADRRFVATDDNDPVLSEALLEAVVGLGRDYADELTGKNDGASDGRSVSIYTEEQRRTFAEATGLEADKVTDDLLAKAGVADDSDDGDGDAAVQLQEQARELAEVKKVAADTAEELRVEKRRNFVDGLVVAGKIEPGATDVWAKRYDRDPDLAREFAEDLKADPSLVREFGAEGDEDEPSEAEAEKRDLAERTEISRRFDIPLERVI